jgi:ABC-2 type transport system ATP-binding protein
MRLITGTLQPDEGAVLLDGVPLSTNLTESKRRIGYLPEANPLYDEMLVAEYLEYVAALRGLLPQEARSGIAGAVDETAIGDVFYRVIGECSKGFRQRIGLAAAILHRPEVLILDEPTEGLDPNQRVEIRRLVGSLGRERTVLLSTHVMQEVEATCSRLVILSRGSLAAKGTVQELLSSRSAEGRYVVEAEGQGVAEALAALDGVTGHRVETLDGRQRVQLEAHGTVELRPRISALAHERGWVLWELHRERVSLERIFRDLTVEGAVAGGARGEGEPGGDGGDATYAEPVPVVEEVER